MSGDFETKWINLPNLILDIENPRYIESVENQHEAIFKMMENEGEKIIELAKSFIELGFIASDLPIVCPNLQDSETYIVKEGNRRIISLKLLAEPAILINKYPKYYEIFKTLQKENKSTPIDNILCCVSENMELINKMIELRHTGVNNGRGLIPWNSQQKSRFLESRGKKSMLMAFLAYLYESTVLDDSQKEKIKSSKKITNLQRLLSDPYVRENSGMIYEDKTFSLDLDNPQKMQVFHRIINDVIADKPIKVEKIYNADKRKIYINEIIASLSPNKVSPSTPKLNNSPVDSSKKNKKVEKHKKAVPHKRNTIIPDECNLYITQFRLIKIYAELKSLDVTKYPNAGMTLLRVFLELSVDYCCQLEKITLNSSEQTLFKKVQKLAHHFEANGQLTPDETKGVKVLSDKSNEDMCGSTNTFNATVHNMEFNPDSEHLINSWDNIEKFMMKIHEVIKSKGN